MYIVNSRVTPSGFFSDFKPYLHEEMKDRKKAHMCRKRNVGAIKGDEIEPYRTGPDEVVGR